jgi:transposase
VRGIPLAGGAVCKIEPRGQRALPPAGQQARAYSQSQDTTLEETPGREHSRRRWLWTVVTPQVRVFQSAPARGAPVRQERRGTSSPGSVRSARAKAYATRPLGRRPLCWAPLRRDFQARLDRGGAAQAPGEIRLEQSPVLFAWGHRRREGTWARPTFQWSMGGRRRSVRDELERGSRGRCPKTAATGLELLARERARWTCGRVEGSAPTQNSAKRRLRHAGLWRKRSYGTQSQRGSRFVAALLTVVSRCQQQGRTVRA